MQRFVRLASALAALCGLAAFLRLASLPGEGLSLFRLVSLAGILLVIATNIFLFLKFRLTQIASTFTETIQRLRTALVIAFVFFAAAFAIWLLILYKELWLLRFSEALYVRSVPVLFVMAVTGFQAGLAFLLPHLKSDEISQNPAGKIWLGILLGFFLIGVLITLTGIGFTYDNVGLNWGPPGVPISFAQVNLVFAVGFLITFVLFILEPYVNLRLADILIFIGLWIATVWLWSGQTMSPSHFAPVVSAPNFETYPYSDAALFDKASYRLVTGVGLGDALFRRPLYVALLAVFHAVGGLSYDGAISIQILLLALIPALLYLLTKRLANRTAGILAGGLIILREANAIRLSGEIPTAHAKLMMSDLPAMLGVIALVYVCIALFQKDKPNLWRYLVIGGILGLMMLVRAQILVLLPLVILLIAIRQKINKSAFINMGLVAAGLVIVITPWAWRNWTITGNFELGDSGEKVLMARNYSSNITEYPTQLPGETADEYSSRLNAQILSYITQHPGDVAFFTANHFLHGVAASAVFVAPAYSNESPAELVSNYPFWGDWNGTLPGGTLPVLLINLALLAFGIALMQARHKLVGWLPLLFFLVYQAGNAVARTSGWRFSLPVDWVIVLYIAVALAYLPSKLDKAADTESTSTAERSGRFNRLQPTLFLLLFLAGLSLPAADRLLPKRNFDAMTVSATDALLENGIFTASELDAFLMQKDVVVESGVALYPRYIRPNGNLSIAEMPQDFRYLHFWLIQESDTQIVLPRETPPGFLPNASTVTVLGCPDGSYVTAQVVIIQTNGGWEFVLQEPPSSLDCR